MADLKRMGPSVTASTCPYLTITQKAEGPWHFHGWYLIHIVLAIQYLLHLVTFLAKLLLNIVCFWLYLCARTWVDPRFSIEFSQTTAVGWPQWSSLSLAPASGVVYNEWLPATFSICNYFVNRTDPIFFSWYHIIPLPWVAYRISVEDGTATSRGPNCVTF